MLYRLSALAERDLDEIWSYIAEDASPEIADRLVDDIIDCLDLLTEQPGMGRVCSEFGLGVRSFAVENYVIYYRQEDDDVLIARVLHGTTRPDRGLVGVKLRFQASPSRRRRSPRAGWNMGDCCSADRAKSLRSASNRSRPFAVLAA